MNLLSLEAKWLVPGLLIFKCPGCQRDWLSCKNIKLSLREQFRLFEAEFGAKWPAVVVGCNPDFCWNFNGTDLSKLTATPSLDASASGHWHGHITNGQIVMSCGSPKCQQ